jgi:hypothetical protein
LHVSVVTTPFEQVMPHSVPAGEAAQMLLGPASAPASAGPALLLDALELDDDELDEDDDVLDNDEDVLDDDDEDRDEEEDDLDKADRVPDREDVALNSDRLDLLDSPPAPAPPGSLTSALPPHPSRLATNKPTAAHLQRMTFSFRMSNKSNPRVAREQPRAAFRSSPEPRAVTER